MDKTFKKYLKEDSMPLRFMNYESDLRRFQETLKDIQKDLIVFATKSDYPAELNKLVNDLDIIDIKMASVRGALKGLRNKYDK
jgi:hypothetical protein